MQPYHPISAFLGVAIGDALGVPFEFMERSSLKNARIEQMYGYGTHNQPQGTWSDDTSLTLCLAESLLTGYDLANMAQLFVQWMLQAYWTAHNEVFDIGFTTSHAISQLATLLAENKQDQLAHLYQYGQEIDNGNGSLMRILPLLWYIKGKPIAQQWQLVLQVSALTHRHIRAGMSCLIYLKFAEYLLLGQDKLIAYQQTQQDICQLWQEIDFCPQEQVHFQRIIHNDICQLDTQQLKTRGYVIDCLESSFWFLLMNNNYQNTVVGIIKMGKDTDTCGAIVGGLAGLYYGLEDIPSHWLDKLARKDDIIKLGKKFAYVYQ